MLYSSRVLQTMMLGALLATGISLTAQDQPAAPAAKAPAKKPATTATTKPGTAKAATGSATALTTQKDKVSYSIGADIGKRLRTDKLDVNPTILARGLREAFAGSKLALTDQEMHAAMMQLQNDMRQKQMAEMQAVSGKNKKEGDAFLAANKSKEGVVTLPSGLQYKILKAGDGPKPAATDSVVCNYRGTLIDGKEFDSSYKRGEPATFPVTGVIKGWTEALQLMPVGSKWQLVIPPDLAYGDRGAGQDIGPGSTLVFEVELMSIQSKDAKDKTGAMGKDQPAETTKPATQDANKPDAPPDKQ
jgi:FKBP-type peptidyl-prolyl cis-trans isomerase FklB